MKNVNAAVVKQQSAVANAAVNKRGRNGFDRVLQIFRVQADDSLKTKIIANNNNFFEQALAA